MNIRLDPPVEGGLPARPTLVRQNPRMSRVLSAVLIALSGCAATEPVGEAPASARQGATSPQPIGIAATASPLPGKTQPDDGEASFVDPTPFLGKGWYGIYVQGEKVGYMSVSVGLREEGGVSTIVCEERMAVQAVFSGQQVKGRMEFRSVYAAGGRQELLEKQLLQVGGGKSVERIGTMEAGQFVVRTHHGKAEPTKQSFPPPKEGLGDHLAARILAKAGASPGTKRKALEFDLELGKESNVTSEVVGMEDVFAEGIQSKVVLIRQGRKRDSPIRLDSSGKYMEFVHSGLLRARLEPEELAKNIGISADLFLKWILRPDKALGPSRRVLALELRLRGTDPAMDLPSTGRQNVTREEDGALLITLRTDVPWHLLPAVSEKEVLRFLRSTPEIPADNRRILTLALTAEGGATSPAEKVRKFVGFVMEYIEDAIRIETVPVLELLGDRKGDCTEHTDLFLSLCRASGIPARGVTGIIYGGDELGGFAGHRWAEVAIDGRWVSADPTWGEFPVDATHIAIGFDESMVGTLRLLGGRVSAEVVSIETGP